MPKTKAKRAKRAKSVKLRFQNGGIATVPSLRLHAGKNKAQSKQVQTLIRDEQAEISRCLADLKAATTRLQALLGPKGVTYKILRCEMRPGGEQ